MSDLGFMHRCDDFALEAVPEQHQAASTSSLFSVILGIPSALVFFAIGGALGEAFGTLTLVTALVVASVVIGAAGWALTSFACRTGLDSDLMSIRAGFGVQGSALTSAIYSVNFVILFAIEAEIIESAVRSELPAIPRVVVLLVAGIVVLALAWGGIAWIAKAMTATLPAFAGLMAWAIVDATHSSSAAGSFWTHAPAVGSVGPTAWLSALAALLAFIVNATVAADVGRFLAPRNERRGALLFGAVLQLLCFGGATLLGAWFAFRLRGESNPGAYLPGLLGGFGVVCVLLSQGRINLINAYSGSLSLANLGARGLGVQPGRRAWMVALVGVATLLAMTRISDHIVSVLTFEAVFVMAWVFVLVAYILRFDPAPREPLDHAPRFEPVGLCALVATLSVATPLAFGADGELGKALAPLIAMVLAPLCVLAFARVWRPSAVARERSVP
jgi:purine-cytosine permease-like protein